MLFFFALLTLLLHLGDSYSKYSSLYHVYWERESSGEIKGLIELYNNYLIFLQKV